jgi:glycosyltransferase involved in cell wall biosynthesis
VPQKHTDIIIASCTKLGLKLTVIGRGPDHARLVKIAGPSVTFVTDASDEQVATTMAGAEAFIFAALDDFGITPIEAMAAGTPVIAYRAGGALDYVDPGVTGMFFDDQTTDSLADALQRFKSSDYDPAAIRQRSGQFSTQTFSNSLRKLLREATHLDV